MINKKHLCKACALILSIAMILSMTVSVFADDTIYVIFVYSDASVTPGQAHLEVGTELGSYLPAASSGYHWEDGNGNEVTSSTLVAKNSDLYMYVYEIADTIDSIYVIFVYSDASVTPGQAHLEVGTELGSNLPAASSGYHWEDGNGNEVTSSTLVAKNSDLYMYVYEIADDSSSGTYGVIYVDEEYHALLVNGEFISIPHTDDNGDGYCDVCNEYIGTDEESSELVSEDVEVNEPVEEGDTKTEDDEDVDVGDDVDETPAEESNPTTGAVITLIPMAIAGLAFVSSKRK